MVVTELENIFCQWLENMGNAGLSVRHVHSFDDMPDGMVLATILITIKPDEERRARLNSRKTNESCPLARLQYVVAISGATKTGEAEQALLSILADVDRHPEMRILPESVTETWWLAHGLSPVPAVHLETCITASERTVNVPLIEKHSINMSGMRIIQGHLVWENGQPIRGAEIQLASLRLTVVSDGRGCFKLNAPGVDLDRDSVLVQARGQQQTFLVADVVTPNGDWLLRMTAPAN